MTFRDEIAVDLDAVFLDEDEFAEWHKVEGKRIKAVLDTARAVPSSEGGELGLSQADYVLIAKTADLPKRKGAGATLNLDGRELTVGKWDEQDGMTVIDLYTPETA